MSYVIKTYSYIYYLCNGFKYIHVQLLHDLLPNLTELGWTQLAWWHVQVTI